MRTERGGILLELTLVAFLLAIFAGGSVRVHDAYRRRFEKIVRERNQTIRAIRQGRAP